MASSPLVSIVVPAYNAAPFLRASLDSVRAQTYPAWEVIIVDDGSTDETVALARHYVEQDSRFMLLQQPNAGVGAARNQGIRRARGAYVAPLDADDVWHPEKLARQVARLEALGSAAGMCYCWSHFVDHDGRLLYRSTPFRYEGRIARVLTLVNFVGNASAPLFRTAALAAVGHYLTRAEQHGVQGCEDWDLSLRVAERFLVGLAPDWLLDYRQARDSMSVDTCAMAQSFEVALARIRERNPELAEKWLRWSAANFYAYLSGKANRARESRSTLHWLRRTIAADPAHLLNPRTSRILVRALARTVIPLQRPPRPPAAAIAAHPLASPGMFERIQAARLRAASEDSQAAATETGAR